MIQSEPLQRCCLTDCRAACCLHGVWIDALEAQDLLEHASLILPHLPEEHQNTNKWFDGRQEPDPHTPSGKVLHSTVLNAENHYGGTACIFLREDHKCALQVAAESAGRHPWRFKPFYCILHPLDLDEEGRITLDETATLLDEPASCLRPSNQDIPLLETFEPELRHFLGDPTFEKLLNRERKLSN